MENKQDFKYKTKFTTTANLEKFAKKEVFKKIKASLNDDLSDLKSLFPSDEEMVKNPDLLYTAFNFAVVNLVNANDDGITTEAALKVAQYFKDKPMNIEHESTNVVGFMKSIGFSTFPDNKTFANIDPDSNKPFNMCAMAIVWKYVAPYVEDAIRDNYFGDVSTSWEIGFDKYGVAIGSKNLDKAKLITDEEEVETYSRFLSCNGGTGFTDDGEEIYRIVLGNAVPLGCAFTFNPAAAVKGVIAADAEKNIVESAKEDFEKQEEIVSQKENKISQCKKRIVNNKHMDFKNLDEVFDHLASASQGDGELAFASVRDFLRDEIKKVNEKYKQMEQERLEKEQAAESALDSARASAVQLEQIKQEFSLFKDKVEAEHKQLELNSRLNTITQGYDLTEKAVKMIAKQINGLSEDEYKTWMEDEGSVILAGKEKKTDVLDKAVASLDDASPDEDPLSKVSQKDSGKKTLQALELGKHFTIKK